MESVEAEAFLRPGNVHALGLTFEQATRLRYERAMRQPPTDAELRLYRRYGDGRTRGMMVYLRFRRELSPAQLRRLRELAFADAGPDALDVPAWRDALGVSAVRTPDLRRRFHEELRAGLGDPPRPPRRGATTGERREYLGRLRAWAEARRIAVRRNAERARRRFLAALSPVGRATWRRLAGMPSAAELTTAGSLCDAIALRVDPAYADADPTLPARIAEAEPSRYALLRRRALAEAGPAALLWPEVAARVGLDAGSAWRLREALVEADLSGRPVAWAALVPAAVPRRLAALGQR